MERGTHVRAQFNKRSVPFVPFLARYSPTRTAMFFSFLSPPRPNPTQPNTLPPRKDSPLLSSIHPNLALASPLIHMQSRMRTSSQARTPRTAHLVFWLRSEAARQISSSRDFYLILPRYNAPNISPPPREDTDRISSSNRRQLRMPKIRLRYALRFRIFLEPSNFRLRVSTEDEIAGSRSTRNPLLLPRFAEKPKKRAALKAPVVHRRGFSRNGIYKKRGIGRGR